MRGSPPPARGKEDALKRMRESGGITPACAGKRLIQRHRRAYFSDHPRLRGEKRKSMVAFALYLGSPPPARGKAIVSADIVPTAGITPACAGKRRHPDRPLRRVRDHPRLRGEKIVVRTPHGSAEGSPPPARGKGASRPICVEAERITPACAGKRTDSPERSTRHPDHPRLRGEK